MRLYGAIQKVEPQDDGTVKVHGIASTESVDDQGEVVRAAAMRSAIPDYMKFPALREMHQLSAAGTALELDCGDDGITRIVAHVVDPVAVTKVKTATYRGFSIGGKVTQREAGNPKNSRSPSSSASSFSWVCSPCSATCGSWSAWGGISSAEKGPRRQKRVASHDTAKTCWTAQTTSHTDLARIIHEGLAAAQRWRRSA
jgi:hypothetical protein